MKQACSMSALLITLGLVPVVGVVHAVAAAPPQIIHPVDSDRATAEQIVSQLGDVDPDVRKLAALRLNSMGGDALQVVEAALMSDDIPPEARVRLQSSLQYIGPRAALERVRATRAKWLADLFHNAYRDGGHTDPKFDADVHAAIDLYLALGLNPLLAPTESHTQTLEAFAKVAQAGCVDPMVLALARLADGRPERSSARPNRLSAEALMYACCQGNYPSLVKFHVWSILCSWRYRKDDIAMLGDLLEAALATPGAPSTAIDEPIRLIPNSAYRMTQPEWRSLVERYERLAPNAPGPMMLQADLAEGAAFAYRDQMLDARKFDLPEHGTYCQMLRVACELADKANERDRLATQPPRFALRILNIISTYEDTRAETDVWFNRAIAADPDDRWPYEEKINNYLSRGRATFDEVLTFGRECERSENWRGGIALTIVVAHEHVANFSGDRQSYFANPDVWNDIETAYEGCLINFPDDLLRRCEFAKYATFCGHWDVADSQFKIIGDKPVVNVFGSETSYNYLRNKATRLAKESSPAETGK